MIISGVSCLYQFFQYFIGKYLTKNSRKSAKTKNNLKKKKTSSFIVFNLKEKKETDCVGKKFSIEKFLKIIILYINYMKIKSFNFR